jgi:hypothetical protein
LDKHSNIFNEKYNNPSSAKSEVGSIPSPFMAALCVKFYRKNKRILIVYQYKYILVTYQAYKSVQLPDKPI